MRRRRNQPRASLRRRCEPGVSKEPFVFLSSCSFFMGREFDRGRLPSLCWRTFLGSQASTTGARSGADIGFPNTLIVEQGVPVAFHDDPSALDDVGTMGDLQGRIGVLLGE